MLEGKKIMGLARRAAAILLAATILAMVPACGAFAAQQPAPSPKVNELLTSLAQEWLQEQGLTKPAGPPPQKAEQSFGDYMNSDAGAIHDQIMALARAVPDLPHEFERAATRVTAIDADSGKGQVFLDLGIFGDPYYVATRRLAAEAQALLNLALFGAFGFGAQWLFRKITERARRRLDGLPMESAKDRLRIIATRFAFNCGAIAVFVLGGLGPLLGLDWDPARRELLLALLTVLVVIWGAAAIGDLLFAPDDERFRIIPTDTAAARFWCRRLTVFTAWFALVWVIIQECDSLDFSSQGLELVGYTLGLGAVIIALEAVWRRPVAPRDVREAVSTETHRSGRGAINTALSIGIVLLWVCWVAAAGVMSVLPVFWLVFVLIILPPAISTSRHAVEHLLRPPGSSQTTGPPSVIEVTLEHGIRALFDHWRGGAARLGLGCRSGAPRRPRHAVRHDRPRRADHRRHPADRRRAVARCKGRD